MKLNSKNFHTLICAAVAVPWLAAVLLAAGVLATAPSATAAAPEAMSFQSALMQMVDENVSVQVQKTNLLAAEQQIVASAGLFLPNLSVGYQVQNAGSVGNSSSYAFTSNWSLFRWGADAARLQSSRLNRDAQSSALASTRLDAETQASEALFELIDQSLRLSAYQRAEHDERNYFEIAEQRFKKSYLSAQELDKVTLDLSNAEALRADTEAQLAHAQAVVTALLGHPVPLATEAFSKWPWESLILALDPNSFGRPGDATSLSSRPDYQAARSTWLANEDLVRSTQRAVLPSLNFSYALSDNFSNSAGEDSGWLTTVGLTLPLFNSLQDETTYKIQVQTAEAAERRLRQLERDISSQQNEAVARFKIAVEQYKNRLKDLSVAERLLAADAARFRMGRADANDVNLDLERVTRSQLLTIQSVHHAHSAYVLLLHSVGKSVL